MIPLLLLKKRLRLEDVYKHAFLMPRILGAEHRGKEVVGMNAICPEFGLRLWKEVFDGQS